MSEKQVASLLVIGTGIMGAGIAQIAATAGVAVFLHDQATGAALSAKERIAHSMKKAVSKGFLSEGAVKEALGHLHPATSIEPAGRVDLVIEAVKEDLAVKQSVFAQLEAVAKPATLFWTNTSMISITRIAENLRHPERFVGAHFFNPVPRMKLVEIIGGKESSEEVIRIAMETVEAWGKTPVRAPDSPGFIVNRVLDAIKREALDLLEEGVPVDQVDTAVRLGLNFPMGPFELMDLIGLNTTLDCLIAQARGMGRPKEFSRRLVDLVAQGNWGRKTGAGFYSYRQSNQRES